MAVYHGKIEFCLFKKKSTFKYRRFLNKNKLAETQFKNKNKKQQRNIESRITFVKWAGEAEGSEIKNDHQFL